LIVIEITIRSVMMKLYLVPGLLFFVMITAACQPAKPACPEGSITYLPDAGSFDGLPGNPAASGSSLEEIGGKMLAVDQVVHGPLCNTTLGGTVYVTCDLQIVAWADEENPTFLKDCDFHVTPGSVVYVAAHNDAAYYQGCSCHTGEAPDG
jgi:hypothetical protein